MSKNKLYTTILVIVVLIAIVGVFAYSMTHRDPNDSNNTNVATSTDSATNSQSPNADIIGNQWVWKYTDNIDGTRIDAPAGEKFVLTFNTDKKFTSTTDCNRLSGSYILDNEILSMGPIVSTKMACAGKTQESEYSKDLGYASSYVITGNELKINLYKDVGTIVFVKKTQGVSNGNTSGVGASPTSMDVSLESLNNKSYVLASYNGTAIASAQKYTLVFGEATTGQKNNFSAKFCNGMGGNYSVTNGTLKGMVMGTMMYCDSPTNLMTIEASFGEMFNDGAKVTLTSDMLTLVGTKGQKFVYSAVK